MRDATILDLYHEGFTYLSPLSDIMAVVPSQGWPSFGGVKVLSG